MSSTTDSHPEDPLLNGQLFEEMTIEDFRGVLEISPPPPHPPLRPHLSRLWRATLTYLAITILFPLTLILLLEIHFALRACLTTLIGLLFYSFYALIHHGTVPPLPILTSILSIYLKTASLGGTRFALMFAPSSLVAGVGAAIMHFMGYLPFTPSHLLSHLTVVNFRTPSRTGIVSLTSVLCDIGVGSVFLILGLCSFFGLQDGVGRGTGVVAEHPWVALAVGMIGSSAVSTYHAVRDAARYADAVDGGDNAGGGGGGGTDGRVRRLVLQRERRERTPVGDVFRERRIPRTRMSAMQKIRRFDDDPEAKTFMEELLPWQEIDQAFVDFTSPYETSPPHSSPKLVSRWVGR
ncbi:hypothetical protein BDY19DRAFT_1049999 [Irpex rosettiformis]|uniref:Uncharacterized protein n=1 Tax=Irpex rosettiformis TaxID=378272 RepID=A0ACB8TW83_9APHY|nr:hypothetical protein BDY19DRAFT_1049999 [Irpex rosettiformis]